MPDLRCAGCGNAVNLAYPHQIVNNRFTHNYDACYAAALALTDGSFFVAPIAYDAPGVGPLFRKGREVFAVFSYDNGPDDGAYCYFTGTRDEAESMARNWNDALRTGAVIKNLSPIVRYF